MNLTLVILAAGVGKRYGGLKQTEPVGPSGESLPEYAAYDALRAGFDRVVFVIRRETESAFRAGPVARIARRAAAECVFQDVPAGRSKPPGTGHAVLVCRDAVTGPFAVVNADDFYGRDSFAQAAQFLANPAGDPRRYAMVGFVLASTLPPQGAVARGVCETDSAGTLRRIEEVVGVEKTADGIRCGNRAFAGNETVSMNLWAFQPSLFALLEEDFRRFTQASAANPDAEFMLPSVLNERVARRQVSIQVLVSRTPWFGITHRGDRQAVVDAIRRLVDAGEYPARLWEN